MNPRQDLWRWELWRYTSVGREVAVVDDARDGTPVLLFHGAPGSRYFRPRERETAAAGVRLVTFDRAGYGETDPAADPSLLAAADEALWIAEEFDRFAIVAWSGGGPAAVATAFRAPERVTHLTLVSCPGPLDEVPGAWDALGEHMRPTVAVARRDPARSVRAVTRHMEPFLADPVSFLGSQQGADAEVFTDPELGPMLEQQVREALRQGAQGIASDLIAMWLPWGFELADVRVPTTVFRAALDRFNGADAITYAARIPDARLVTWPDVGHLGILRHWSAVLASVG